MYDPERDPRRTVAGAGFGIMSAFLPTGAVGILAGAFILLVLAIAGGVVHGIWLIAAIAGVIVLVPLLRRALKAEIRREDRAPRRLSQDSSLPDDSQISEEERRQAMRDYRNDREDT